MAQSGSEATKFTHQFPSEYPQMWITSCSSVWQGSVWNQLSTCLPLASYRTLCTPCCVDVLMLAICGILTTWHSFCACRPHVSGSLQWEILTEPLGKVAVSRVAALVSAWNTLGSSDGVIHSRICRTSISCGLSSLFPFRRRNGSRISRDLRSAGFPQKKKIHAVCPSNGCAEPSSRKNLHAESSSNLPTSTLSGGALLFFCGSALRGPTLSSRLPHCPQGWGIQSTVAWRCSIGASRLHWYEARRLLALLIPGIEGYAPHRDMGATNH